MSQELHYTSAPRGLKPGSRGFCTVACTPNMPAPLADRLEGLSGYQQLFPPHHPDVALNPVVYSHLRIPVAGKTLSVVSRIGFAGLDYTERSNKYAHHIVLEAHERPAGGPAWTMSQPGFLQTSWTGDPRILPSGRRPDQGNSVPAVASAWKQQTGDAGWAGVLAESFLADPKKVVYLVFQPGMDLLPLIAEAIALLPPERRWDVTFSTYYTNLPQGVSCAWRCVLEGSEEARRAQRLPDTLVLNLTTPMGTAVGGALVQSARDGIPVGLGHRGTGHVDQASHAMTTSAPPELPPGASTEAFDLSAYAVIPSLRDPSNRRALRRAKRLKNQSRTRRLVLFGSITMFVVLLAVVGAFAGVHFWKKRHPSSSPAKPGAVVASKQQSTAKGVSAKTSRASGTPLNKQMTPPKANSRRGLGVSQPVQIAQNRTSSKLKQEKTHERPKFRRPIRTTSSIVYVPLPKSTAPGEPESFDLHIEIAHRNPQTLRLIGLDDITVDKTMLQLGYNDHNLTISKIQKTKKNSQLLNKTNISKFFIRDNNIFYEWCNRPVELNYFWAISDCLLYTTLKNNTVSLIGFRKPLQRSSLSAEHHDEIVSWKDEAQRRPARELFIELARIQFRDHEEEWFPLPATPPGDSLKYEPNKELSISVNLVDIDQESVCIKTNLFQNLRSILDDLDHAKEEATTAARRVAEFQTTKQDNTSKDYKANLEKANNGSEEAKKKLQRAQQRWDAVKRYEGAEIDVIVSMKVANESIPVIHVGKLRAEGEQE